MSPLGASTFFSAIRTSAMNASTPERKARHSLKILVPVLTAALLLAGCSGDSKNSASSSSSQQGNPQAQQQQGQPNQGSRLNRQSLSASDVSKDQLQQAAQIAVSTQMATRQDRMKMRKDMRKKYGNPKQMDSTRKAKARKEMQRRQMEMRKKQKKIIQKQAKKVGMNPQMFRRIMRSAQKDSTLKKQLQTAMKTQMRERMGKMKNRMEQNPNQQNQ
jgi:hypothetical protein